MVLVHFVGQPETFSLSLQKTLLISWWASESLYEVSVETEQSSEPTVTILLKG